MMRSDPALFKTPEYAKFDPNNSNITNLLLPEARGVALLKQTELFKLDSQQRSLSAQHTANIKLLSTHDPRIFPITDELLDCYPQISTHEIAADPLWYNAPIVVPNNKIRHKINQTRLIAHAKNKGSPILFWRNQLVGANAQLLSTAEQQQLYSTHLSLTSYFAPGVVSYMTENLCQRKGIVNGAACTTHSLTPHPDEDAERAKHQRADGTPTPPLHECIRQARPGDMVQLFLPPLSINVKLHVTADNQANFTDADTLVLGDIVVPMLVSPFPKSEDLSSWELVDRQRDPFRTVSYLDHGLDLGFAITYHKIQVLAQRIPAVLLCLSDPNLLFIPGTNYSAPHLGLEQVAKGQAHTSPCSRWPYACARSVSRQVCHPSALASFLHPVLFYCSETYAPRIMPMQPGQTRVHLYKLRADCEMLAFLQGFNTPDRKWSPMKAHNALEKSGKNALHKVNSQRTCPSTPRKSNAQETSPSTPTSSKHRTPQQQPRTPASPAPLPSRAPQRLMESRRFTIASEGRISNMQHFRKQFKSFHNSGEGDCLFESFRQSLQLTDSVQNMRNRLVDGFETAPPFTRVSQLNEHIMRELDVHNRNYAGYTALSEVDAHLTIQSQAFTSLWAQYVDDMANDHAYAGNAEAAALAAMYGVNVSIWAYRTRSSITTATHLISHLQSPLATRTVHILNISNGHYESTNMPMDQHPILPDISLQSAISPGIPNSQLSSTRSLQSPMLQNAAASSAPSSAAQATLHDATPQVPLSEDQFRATQHPIEHAPKIEDYCGLVLNDQSYFHAILNKTKIYELRTTKSTCLRPRVVLHPNKNIRDSGYQQNIEAEIQAHLHDKPLSTAKDVLDATSNGADLGLTEEQTRQLVREAKQKTFYLYKLSNPKPSPIVWIDSPIYNQILFSPHQYENKETKEITTLFHFPSNASTPPQVLIIIILLHSSLLQRTLQN